MSNNFNGLRGHNPVWFADVQGRIFNGYST